MDNSYSLPKRPPTPTLDQLFADNIPPGGRSRFELSSTPANGWIDQALILCERASDWKNEPINVLGVNRTEAAEAREWIVTTQPAAIRFGGGTLPSGNPNDPAFVYTPAEWAAIKILQLQALQAPPPASAAPEPPAPPNPPQKPGISGTGADTAGVATTPVPEIPGAAKIHEAHAESWLKKLGHAAGDITKYATPDNIAKIAAVLQSLAPLMRHP